MEISYLYVIAADPNGPTKLGISKDPDSRLRQLQTGHAQRLRLYYQEPVPASQARLFEGLLHRQVSFLRTHGEWFDLSVADAIAHVQFTLIEHQESELVP